MKIQTKIFLTICAISMTHTISYAQFNTVSMERSFYKVEVATASDKVYAMMPGRVLKVGYDKISGNYVTLQHGSITVSYCHLSQVLKNKNELVTVGEVVGVTGNTGRSTGEHLHLTCKIKGRAIDPSLILDYITRLTLNPNDVRPNT